jgi:hypothetical protein
MPRPRSSSIIGRGWYRALQTAAVGFVAALTFVECYRPYLFAESRARVLGSCGLVALIVFLLALTGRRSRFPGR